MKFFAHMANRSLCAALAIIPVAAMAEEVQLPEATFENLPRATKDGLTILPADGASIMGSFAVGTQQIRFQVHEAFIPDPSMFQMRNGQNSASIGGCLADESGLIISGWGIDADGEEYAQYPQIMGDGLVAPGSAVEEKVKALNTWCTDRKASVDGFVSMMRQLEFERSASQENVFHERLPAWTLLMSQARDLDALCQFAASEMGRSPKAGQFYQAP